MQQTTKWPLLEREYDKAITLLRRMLTFNVEPSQIMYTKILNAFYQVGDMKRCDSPNLRCSLTTCQPVENLYVSYYETHT